MSRINLLPWREARRKALQTQFYTTLLLVAIVAGLVWYGAHLHHKALIDLDNYRISYVAEQIAAVDEKIKEIEELEREKARLLSRMRAIEQLQGNRPLIVRLFDELITSLPEGVSVTQISQSGSSITINGLAQSNARISSFMRNLESSEWLASPNLQIIQESGAAGNRPINSFTLTFTQVIPAAPAG